MTQIETFIRGIHARPVTKELNAYNGTLGAEWDYGGVLTAAVATTDLWPVKIVDLSYWNGAVNFEKLATKAQVVILRAVYGNKYIDSKLDEYYRGAKDNGLEVMLYHYLKPANNWKTHAETLVAVNHDYPNLYLWGDLEENGGLNKTLLESWIKKYFDKVGEETKTDNKIKIGCYTSAGFLNANLGMTNWLKWLELWVASWTTGPAPLIPNEWNAISNPRTWKLWQWSSKGAGADYGVSSKYIDLNRYHGSIAEFNAEYGTNIQPLEGEPEPPPPPPPPPDPEPIPEENIMKWYVKATTTPYLNVRATPGGVDVGDLLPNRQFNIKNVVYANGAWAQLFDTEFAGKWVCLENAGGRYCEPVGM